jgi:hypothetical protein
VLCTDIDEQEAVQHRQKSRWRHTGVSRQLLYNATSSTIVVVARPDTAVQDVDVPKGEDDRKDPIHSRQGKHRSDEDQKPFP